MGKKYVDLDKVLDRVGNGLAISEMNIKELEGLLMASQPTAEILDRLERVKKGHEMIKNYIDHLRKEQGWVNYQDLKIEY